jgi:hypothetical protein
MKDELSHRKTAVRRRATLPRAVNFAPRKPLAMHRTNRCGAIWSVKTQPKEEKMPRLVIVIAAATTLFGANLTATAAKAEMNYGPMKNGDKCFVKAHGWAQENFGYWQSCPESAAAASAQPQVHQHNGGKRIHHDRSSEDAR